MTTLECRNVSYKLSKQVIIQNVSFGVQSGDMIAIMGPSGAGKSTLLDLMANRKKVGQQSGDILFNGKQINKYFHRDSAYVLQNDVHIAVLTVHETVQFSASTRLPEGTTKNQVNERVDTILELMGLMQIKNSIVGSALVKRISGGELKRLSIAVEIVALPTLIFLDEPTSGLDSTKSLDVMKFVRKLSNHGRTIFATIHQPSPEVFNLFNKVILLSGGRLVYFGKADHVIPYFTQPDLGFQYLRCQNVAEYLLDICSGRRKPEGNNKELTSELLEQRYQQSQQVYSVSTIEMDEVRNPIILNSEIDNKFFDTFHSFPAYHSNRLHATSKLTQFVLLMKRNMTVIFRSHHENRTMFFKSTFIGLLIGIVFYNQCRVNPPLFVYGVPSAQVTNISAILFFMIIDAMISNAHAIPELNITMNLFNREIAAYAYSCSPFWLAKVISVLPVLFLNQVYYFMLVAFLVGFSLKFDFLVYYVIVAFLVVVISYYTALIMAATFEDSKLALSLFPLSFIVFSNFSGFSINIDSVPIYWQWMTYFSFSRWSFEGLIVNQWTNYDESNQSDDYAGGGEGVISLYGFTGYDKNETLWLLFIYVIGYAVICYFAMKPSISKLEKCDNVNVDDVISESNQMSRSIENKSYNLLSTESKADDESFLKPLLDEKTLAMDIEDHSIISLEDERSSVNITSIGCNLEFYDIRYSIETYSTTALPQEEPNSNSYSKMCKLISLDFNKQKTRKDILKGISGAVHSKEMCALLGASGAGKSTLLDILAGRKNINKNTIASGKLSFNGKPCSIIEHMKSSEENQLRFARTPSIAYVMQDNVHIAELTVRETLMFAAELRMADSRNLSYDLKLQRVQTVVSILGLHDIMNSLVGDESKRGISGGQLKRLSIGVEIINLPDLIFLDEPTTGLDSAKAYEVMLAIRQLANQGRTVVCTIHQPSQETFDLFDKVLIVADGRMTYFGQRSRCIEYFTTNPNFRFKFDGHSNTADFLIDVVSGVNHSIDGKDTVTPEQFESRYLQHPLGLFLKSKSAALLESMKHGSSETKFSSAAESSKPSYSWVDDASHLFFNCRILFQRQRIRTKRNPQPVRTYFMKNLFVSLFYSSLYYNQPTGTDSFCYLNRMAVIFLVLLSMLVGTQFIMAEVIEDRLLYYRERGAGAYGPLAYWLSSSYIHLFTIPISSFQYIGTLYYVVNFKSDVQSFLFFYLVSLLIAFTGFFTCYFMASISSSTQVAVTLFPTILFFSVVFCGYIVYIPTLPLWLRIWAPDLSFVRFAFQALVLNEFEDNANLPDGTYYIENLGFNTFNKSFCVTMLLIFLGITALGSFIMLKYMNFEHR